MGVLVSVVMQGGNEGINYLSTGQTATGAEIRQKQGEYLSRTQDTLVDELVNYGMTESQAVELLSGAMGEVLAQSAPMGEVRAEENAPITSLEPTLAPEATQSPQISSPAPALTPEASSEPVQIKTPQSATQAATEAENIINTVLELKNSEASAPAENASAETFVNELSKNILEMQGVRSGNVSDLSWKERTSVSDNGDVFLKSKSGKKDYRIPSPKELNVTVRDDGAVSLTSNILEDVNSNDYRDFAKAYADNHLVTHFDKKTYAPTDYKPYVIKSDGNAVIITTTGINDFAKKLRGAGLKTSDNLSSLLVLDRLIENATKEKNTTNRHSASGNPFAYYNSVLNINGRDYLVKIYFNQTQTGDHYYYHALEKTEVEPLNVASGNNADLPPLAPLQQAEPVTSPEAQPSPQISAPETALAPGAASEITQTNAQQSAAQAATEVTKEAQLIDILANQITELQNQGKTNAPVENTSAAQKAEEIVNYLLENQGGNMKPTGTELPSSYISSDVTGKSVEDAKRVTDYLCAVDDGVKAFVEDSLKTGRDKFRRYKFSGVNERQVADVLALTGIDVSEYQNGMNTNGVLHIERRHGVNGEADTTMSDTNDYARIPYVVDNYDSVELAYDSEGQQVFSKAYMDANNNPAPVIRFTKKVDGVFYVSEAVPDSAHKTLWIESAYINKKNKDLVRAEDVSDETPSSTSETPHTAVPISDNSILNSAEKINPATESPAFDGTTYQIQRDSELKRKRLYPLYEGEVPQSTGVEPKTIEMPESTIKKAEALITTAENRAAEGNSFISELRKLIEGEFEASGGARGVNVDSVRFDDKPYIVTLNKNLVNKVLSSSALSAENIAAILNIDDIVEQGNYINSGQYVQKGKTQRQVIRYDYFNTNMTSDGESLKCFFDVEVYKNQNNYRTHYIVNEMELSSTTAADTDSTSAAAGEKTTPSDIKIAQNGSDVNSNGMQEGAELSASPAFDGTTQKPKNFAIGRAETPVDISKVSNDNVGNQDEGGPSNETDGYRGENAGEDFGTYRGVLRSSEGPTRAVGSKKEGNREFLERARSEGKAVRQVNGKSYSYMEVQNPSEIASAVIKELNRLGVQGFIYDGDLEINSNGVTTAELAKYSAESLFDGSVAIRNDAKVNPREVAAHESFHSWIKSRDVSARRFFDLSDSNLNKSSNSYIRIAQKIIKSYWGEDFDITTQYGSLDNEYMAFICGELYADPQTAKERYADTFNDWNEVVLLHNEMISSHLNAADANSAGFSMPDITSVSDGTGAIAEILPEDGNYETANNALYAVNPELMKAGNAVSKGWNKFYQRMVSGQAPIEAMGPDAAALVQLCRQAGGVVGTIAETGLVTPQGEYVAPAYVDVFVKSIPKERRAAFNEYRQQLHNIDRMSLSLNADYDLAMDAYNEFVANNPEYENFNEKYLQKLAKAGDGNPAAQYISLRDAVELAKEVKDKPVVGHENGTPYTAEESSEYVAEVEALHPEWVEIKNAQNMWWDIFNREWLVKPGIITEAAYDELRAKYPNYIPTYRVDGKKGGTGLFAGRISANVIKEAKGSVKEVLPLEQQFIEQINRVIQIARRNELGQYLYNYAAMNPTEAAKQGIAISNDADKTVEAALGESYVDSQETETLKQLPGGKYQFNVKLENGKTGQLAISKEIYQAIDWIRSGGMGDAISPIVKTLSKISAPIKAGITGYNPLFIVSNFFRDMQTYLVNCDADNLAKAYSYYGKAAVEVAKKGEHYRALKALGGLNSGYYKVDEAYKVKKEYGVTGKLLTAIPEGIGIASEYIESVPRMAQYLILIDKYGNTPEGRRRAASGAADVTVNFSRSGPISRALNSGVLYFNANIQGIDKTVRQLKAHPVRTLGRAAGTVLLTSIILGLINKNNPWYDDLDKRTKDSYFIIPNLLGEKDEDGYCKTFFKVPRSREYGIVFGAVFDRTLRALETGKWEDAYQGVLGEIWSNFAPPDITTDNILSMFTRVGLFDEEDQGRTWYGGNIVPDSMANVSPENQHDINTSGLATNIGKATGLSPKKVDNIIDSYGGYIGDLLQAATSPKNAGDTPSQTFANALEAMLLQPFEKRFTADPVYQSGVVDEFYTLKDEATKMANDRNIVENIPGTIRTPEEKALSFINELSAQLSDLYKQEKAMYAEPGSFASKQQQSRELREQMNELTRGAEAQYKQIIEDEQKKWDELGGIIDVQVFYDEVAKAAAVEGDKSRLSRNEAIVMIDNHFDSLSPDKKALLFDLAGELTTNGAAWKNNPYR